MRGLALLLLLGLAWAQGGEERALARCLEVVRALEVQALYREDGVVLVLLGRERPFLLLALEGGRPMPHAGPPRGRPMGRRPLPFLRELTLARFVAVGEKEYRCFVLHRGRVVGVLRLAKDFSLLPLEGFSP
ncbi:hypothetical protein TJA_09090 [Thermus sp. LT1-2-5]|uniref:hypothetical protein n=1 Tax=Thermus sp. LT1-2-5 TaxID=3026935 RepID=UPI0030EA43A0